MKNTMKHNNLWLALIVLLILVLLWSAFIWEPGGSPQVKQAQPYAANASLQLAGTPKGGDFTLLSPSGPVALSGYHGKVVLIYFGYTFCPDVCPTSLSRMAEALSLLNPNELKSVAGLFISVDQERDTMDVLKAYAPFFHPNIVGISGTPEQVAQVALQYGASYMKQKPNADGLYSVDHSSVTYVVAPDGKLAANLPHGTPPGQIVNQIRRLLKPEKAD